MSELARETGISRVTGMRLLAELEGEKMLEQRPGGGHRLGVEFLKLAAVALSEENLSKLSQRVITRLSEVLQLSAYLVLPQDDKVLYLLREVPQNRLVSNVSVGSLVPAHLTTPGRALLSQHSEQELRDLFGQEPLEVATENSPATYASLAELLDLDRTRGCAWSHGGFEPGIDSCAAPVLGSAGEPIAAISVAGPSALFTPEFMTLTQQEVIAAADDLTVMLNGVA